MHDITAEIFEMTTYIISTDTMVKVLEESDISYSILALDEWNCVIYSIEFPSLCKIEFSLVKMYIGKYNNIVVYNNLK